MESTETGKMESADGSRLLLDCGIVKTEENESEKCDSIQNTVATENQPPLTANEISKLSKRAQKRLQKKALYESCKKEKRY